MFNAMMDGIREESVGNLFNLQFEIPGEPDRRGGRRRRAARVRRRLPGVTAGGAQRLPPPPAAPAARRPVPPPPPAPQPRPPPAAAAGRRPAGRAFSRAAGRGRHAADGRGHATAAGRGQAATQSSGGAHADRTAAAAEEETDTARRARRPAAAGAPAGLAAAPSAQPPVLGAVRGPAAWSGTATPRRPVRQRRPQRPVPVRFRPQVQALPRRPAGLALHAASMSVHSHRVAGSSRHAGLPGRGALQADGQCPRARAGATIERHLDDAGGWARWSAPAAPAAAGRRRTAAAAGAGACCRAWTARAELPGRPDAGQRLGDEHRELTRPRLALSRPRYGAPGGGQVARPAAAWRQAGPAVPSSGGHSSGTGMSRIAASSRSGGGRAPGLAQRAWIPPGVTNRGRGNCVRHHFYSAATDIPRRGRHRTPRPRPLPVLRPCHASLPQSTPIGNAVPIARLCAWTRQSHIPFPATPGRSGEHEGATAAPTPSPSWRCARRCTPRATATARTSGSTCRCAGSARTSRSPAARSPCSSTAASGTPAPSTAASRRTTTGTGRRSWRGTWSATAPPTRPSPRPAGRWSGCGSTCRSRTPWPPWSPPSARRDGFAVPPARTRYR